MKSSGIEKGLEYEADVLIIDDNPENLRLLSSILNQQNYKVRPAASGTLAIQAVCTSIPDIILLDIRMPDMDGYEVCKKLKEDERTKEIPVIFVSALEEAESKARAFQCGGVDYLTKPYQEAEVLARIKSHLSLHRMQQGLEDMVAQRTGELQQAKEEWERTFQAIGEIATIQDNQQRIVRVNQRACETLALPFEEMEGRFCYEVFRGIESPCPGCPVFESSMDGLIHEAEIEHAKLGKVFVVSASPIINDKKQITGIVHLARDITEQKKLEAQLRQAQKMEAIGTLAGGIAHDFNNILSPILGYSEMTLDVLSPEAPLSSDIKQVIKAANRAKELVNQILTFSRQTEQTCTPLRIQYVVKEALKLLRASIPTTIEIQNSIDMQCGAIHADPTQIHQVIMNLCTNAYHAMQDSGGVLDVQLREVLLEAEQLQDGTEQQAGRYARLTVGDNGHGMPPEIIDKIFDPYFTTKGQGEGTGLGLSVVHGIVTSVGGSIAVSSTVDKGTIIHAFFPILETDDCEDVADDQLDLPRGNERVLVVDDEQPIIEMEVRILERLGYTVKGFTDSEELLSYFRQESDKWDLVITDMAMPKCNGVELAVELQKIKEGIPIILCSGFTSQISEKEVRAKGIKEFILKPLKISDFAVAVRNVLDEVS